jgi:hypothetical protein
MPKRSYKGDKRRREIEKKKKKDAKFQRKISGETKGPEGDDAYLEYLNPSGPVRNDMGMEEDEDDSEESEDQDTDGSENANGDDD